MQNKIINSASARIVRILKAVPEMQRREILQTVKDKLCPVCGSRDLRQVDDFVVCMSCAYEQPCSDFSSSSFLFSDNPGSNLAFGRGLGTVFSRRGLFRILAKAPAETKNIGLRRRYMNIMSSQNEPHEMHRMLEVGSDLCREFGIGDEDFVDYLGKVLQRVCFAALLQKTLGESLQMKKLAVVVFVYVWQLRERDRGLRKEIEFEPYFPGKRDLLKSNKYKVDKRIWDYVYFTENKNLRPMVPQQPPKIEHDLTGKSRVLKWLLQGSKLGKYRSRRVELEWNTYTERERALLRPFYDIDKNGESAVVKKGTVDRHICSAIVMPKSLRRGALANVLNALLQLEETARTSGEVDSEQVRAAVNRLNLPGKSARKRRQKTYDLYALLVSVLAIKAGFKPDLFIRSVVLQRLLEVYRDRAQLKRMPWGTRSPYSVVTRTLEQMPLKLKQHS